MTLLIIIFKYVSLRNNNFPTYNKGTAIECDDFRIAVLIVLNLRNTKITEYQQESAI
jgi:hypothetical protein